METKKEIILKRIYSKLKTLPKYYAMENNIQKYCRIDPVTLSSNISFVRSFPKWIEVDANSL